MENNYKVENPIYKYKKLIFIFVIIFLTVIATISNWEDVEEALHKVKNTSLDSVVILSVLLIIYLVVDALILKACVDDKKIGFKNAFIINMAGSFFSAITPMYIGSYPSRIFYLYKDGVPVETSLSALTVKGITYQLIINCFALFSLIFVDMTILSDGGYSTILVIGFVYNLGVTLILVLISSSKKINEFALRLIQTVTNKVKWFRAKQAKVMASVSNYYTNTRRMYCDRPYTLRVGGYTLIKLVIFNVFPIVVFYGLGIDFKEYALEIFGLSAITAIIVSVVPTPGGMVASEFVFQFFYTELLNAPTTVKAGLLIWRLFTYYIIIVLGLIATLYLQTKKPKNGGPIHV